MNPFIFGKIVSGENFYDRVEETKKIVTTLSGGNNLVLYSPRRYGKSSLVFKAFSELEKMNFICIYLDMMMVYSRDTFVQNYSQAILSKQSNLTKAVQKVATIVKGFKPVLTFDENARPEISINYNESHLSDFTIEEILDLPENLSNGKKKYIVVMDEFQEITKLNGEGFENIIRSKIQHHKNVNYMFLGSKHHLLQEMFSNKKRPLYNSAYIMQLDKLPVKDSINFLKNKFAKFKIKLSNENAKYLLESVDNIPYYIQLLASEIWQYLVTNPTEITKEIIDTSTSKIIELKNDYYYSLLDNLSLYQRKLLKALSVEGVNIYSVNYQTRFRLGAISSTQRSITSLIESGIIEKEQNSYIYSDPFFKEFVKNYT